ncbi:zonadhesin [Bactrocera dorsalis]|uniref:Zonadhesin n=1 Tax=Bactrocera dorsalis TaxID=27457 RepID=A0A6I9UXY9_BACDO|nr:zonadhesin [Bactrocera dorsalis]
MPQHQSVKRITHLQLIFICCLIFYWMHNVSGAIRRVPDRSRIPCENPEPLPNGFSALRRRNMMLLHYCNYGFKLFGDRRTTCNRGKWVGNRPICASNVCSSPTKNPENGRIQYVDQYHIGVYCSEGFELAGNRYAYCNGTDWDRPLGYCRRRPGRVSHECDFEPDDKCGWVTDIADGFQWKRTMATNVFTSFHTGPRHDHTTMQASGGHYMLMESFGATSTPAALTSPIYERAISLKTACCFQFYYLMYGAGVGNLRVYIKPLTKMLSEVIDDKETYLKFTKSGNQNSNWNEAHFSIDEQEDDFQIVFVADGAKNHLSDIAIDDVKIMFGTECKALDNHDDEADDSGEYEPTTTEQSLYDTLSCVSRCGTETNSGIMRNATHLIGLCSCHDSCIADDDCCPDYTKVCLDAPPESSTVNIPETTTTTVRSDTKSTTTTTLKEIITTKPTTTSSTTTTTTTTSTTTTKKPTTITKKATTTNTTTTTLPPTTSTTRKPTTIAKNTTTTQKPTTTSTRKLITTSSTTPKPKPTTTKRATPSTTTTTTTTTTTIRTIPTTITSSTKRSTTSTTTLPVTQPYTLYTQPILSVTTVASVNRKTAAGETKELPTKNQTQTNANTHTWEWHPKPESNPRENLVLLFIFGVLLIAIATAVVYRRKEAIKAIWLRKNENEGGAEDTNSIIANFATDDTPRNGGNTPGGSTAGNHIKLSFPGLKKGKPDKRARSDEEPLFSENQSDGIPLL